MLGLNTVYKKDKDKTDNETFVYSIFWGGLGSTSGMHLLKPHNAVFYFNSRVQ